MEKERIRLAQDVTSKLIQDDELELFKKLGLREKAIEADLSKANSFEPKIEVDDVMMGKSAQENLKAFGENLFNRLNREFYELICGADAADTEDRNVILKAFGLQPAELAAYLSGFLIAHMAIAPAIAIVVATILAKRFALHAHGALCDVWKNNL